MPKRQNRNNNIASAVVEAACNMKLCHITRREEEGAVVVTDDDDWQTTENNNNISIASIPSIGKTNEKKKSRNTNICKSNSKGH